MIELDANLARFYFNCPNLPPEVLQVGRFSLKETLSDLWFCHLELVSDDALIDFEAVVNERATFIMKRGFEDVLLHGIVIDFEQMGRMATDRILYRAVLAPSLWRLTLNYQSRIFQHKSLEQTLTEVLEGGDLVAGTDFEFRLSEALGEEREYVVQFCERDLDFFHRQLEHEGVWYFFEQGDDREKLIITDKREEITPIAEPTAVVYHDQIGIHTAGEEVLRQFTYTRQMVPAGVKMKTYNYEDPTADLLVESTPDETTTGDFGTYYKYGEHYKTTDVGERLAQVRHEELVCRRKLLEGQSTCMGLRTGYTFDVAGHYRSDLDETYFLVEVEHRGSQWAAMELPGEEEETYANAFKCLPATAPYRPERKTKRPEIPGLFMGKVDQADDEQYADIDEQGRCRLRMDFDLSEPPPMEGTLPVPENQPYTGPGYGMRFPHLKDAEAMWTCFNGDVDQPRIVGTKYNPVQTAPVVEENKTHNLLRTMAGNEMLMEDKSGVTKISLTTPGGHNETLDDGEQRIILSSSGGHTGTLDDKNQRIELKTTGEHVISMDDGAEGEFGISIMIKTAGDYGAVFSDSMQALAVGTAHNRALLMHDVDQLVLLKSDAGGSGGHSLEFHDAENHIKMESNGGHNLRMLDDERAVILESADGNLVDINDEDTMIQVVLQRGEGHSLQLSDGGEGSYMQMATTNDEIIRLDDDAAEGILLDSQKKIKVTALTEIKFEVGGSSITLAPDGITISGPMITSEAQGEHFIRGTKVNIN